MNVRTESELLFELFCKRHGLHANPVPTSSRPTPDYELSFGEFTVIVEIKQIESDEGLDPTGVSSRTVGAHVRRKIEEARKQVQAASSDSFPTLLLIYNKVDEQFQSFGTEPHDFICAMYGERVVHLIEGKSAGSYHGRNASFRSSINTSFSAVGHLRRTSSGAEVKIYENARVQHSFCNFPKQ